VPVGLALLAATAREGWRLSAPVRRCLGQSYVFDVSMDHPERATLQAITLGLVEAMRGAGVAGSRSQDR